MLQDQQDHRIMAYFIEEAKDHLNTIEQGLLNLQSTLAEPELLNEVFRAAHSVKGGAAMLGLSSVQQVAHRLEDSFKILQENPTQVDQHLESLFLRVYDTLQALLDQLSNSFGLTEDTANLMVKELEPVFTELNTHIQRLVSGEVVPENTPSFAPSGFSSGLGSESLSTVSETRSDLDSIFVPVINGKLREMLEIFKSADTPSTRHQLQQICQELIQAGEQCSLKQFIQLTQTVQTVVTDSQNTYALLAPIVIKELHGAKDLVLAKQDAQIRISDQLKQLVPVKATTPAPSDLDLSLEELLADTPDLEVADLGDLSELFASPTPVEPLKIDNVKLDDWFLDMDAGWEGQGASERSRSSETSEAGISDFSGMALLDESEEILNLRTGPEVGEAELHSLADLFEGEVPDLEGAWEEETVETPQSQNLASPKITNILEEDTEDFTDLLFASDLGNGSKNGTQLSNVDDSSELLNAPLDDDDFMNLFPDTGELDIDEVESESDSLEEASGDLADLLSSIDETPYDSPHPAPPSRSPNPSLSQVSGINLDKGDEADVMDDDFSDLLFEAEPESPPETIELSAAVSSQTEADEFQDLLDMMNQESASEQSEIDPEFLEQMLETVGEKSVEMPADEGDWSALFGEEEITPAPNLSATVDLPSDQDEDAQFWGELTSENSQVPTEEALELNATETSDVSATVEDVNLFAELEDAIDLETEMPATPPPSSTSTLEDEFLLEELLGESGDTDIAVTDESLREDLANLDILGQLETELNNTAVTDESLLEDLAALDALLDTPPEEQIPADSEDGFADLEALLNTPTTDESPTVPLTDDIFASLENLLENPGDSQAETILSPAPSKNNKDTDFSDLEMLLEETNRSASGRSVEATTNRRASRKTEPTMRVSVKQLDNLSNLMGELVVNRNSLEQDQERMRQFLDNLLHQVSLLGDVGQRMQDLYERSLLEIALLASRHSWRSGDLHGGDERGLGDLEMDRFTPFHTLSQEIIELIVRVRESSSDIEFLVEEAEQVTRQLRQVTDQLQEGLTRARMVPFSQIVDRLHRPVRDISIRHGKQAQLVVEGRNTLIDKVILDELYSPMTHLVNNAIAHGIEPAEVREAKGKPAQGTITIRVFHQGNQTVISVGDDGGGIDSERVKRKALEKGLISQSQAKSMTEIEVYDLLFHAGFSTRDQADDISGRGVGMDVVRTALSELRGTISTDSKPGKGTTFTIRLPLMLSISKALCCISDRHRIAFPMDGVEDMLDVPKEEVKQGPDGQQYIDWRGVKLPFRHLRELLTYNRYMGRGNVYGSNTEEDLISVIVLRSAGNYLAVQVDQVLNEQEIVIKQLEGPIPKPVGVAGATVLGDGQIVAIADVLELLDLVTGRLRKDVGGSLWGEGQNVVSEAPAEKTEPTVLIVDDSITVRELLSMTFNKAGYRVEQARDGKEAWEKLKSGLPCDIVFCDIEMPRMDGLELLSRMQKDPTLTTLPIAMLTSRGADRHRQMAYSLGARGYFTKPYLEEHLLDAAQRMLKGEIVGATAVTG